MKKSDKVFCSICLAILLFFFFSISVRFLTRQVLVKHFGISNALTSIVFFDIQFLNGDNAVDAENAEMPEQRSSHVDIDWAALYPFSEATLIQKAAGDEESEAREESNEKSAFALAVERLIQKIDSLEKYIEMYASDYLVGYHSMTELAKKYEKALNWNYVSYSEYNGVVEASDGYLITLQAKTNVQEHADSVKSLADYCLSAGIGFLYVNTPVKVCEETDIGISGVIDFSNQNADDFLAILRSKGISHYDLRIPLHDEGYDHHSMFFKTDHHWHPETGLWSAGKILSALNASYGFQADTSYADPNKYKKEVYPEWFLGSQGKKVTLSRAHPEDFTLLYPENETLLHYEVKSEGIDSDGDFSILYDMDCLREKNYYQDPYLAYIYGNQPLERIENKLVDNGYHILVIHDSFGNCVIPFLAMGIQYVDAIDLRYFDGSLQTYIEAEHPDAVVVIYNSGMLNDLTIRSGGLFDFR